jgi:hypothetical protein
VNRRKFLAAIGFFSLGGCSSSSEQELLIDSDFFVINSCDTVVQGSVRIKDENGGTIDQEGFLVDSGETSIFTAGLQDTEGIIITVDLDHPEETTYDQTEIPAHSEEYEIDIHSDGIDVEWTDY